MMAMPIRLYMVYDLFRAITAELIVTIEIILFTVYNTCYLALQENVCQPLV